MIDVADDKIFVAIAAYREPELRRTIESCVAMSLPVTALYSSRQYMAAKTRIFLDYFIEHVDGKADSHGVTGRTIQ